MQPGLLEKIKKLVEVSTILKPAEKTQWLEMLPLMNDKQVSELETILNGPSAGATDKISGQGQQTSAASQSSENRLSHISNLPASFTQSAKKPEAVMPVRSNPQVASPQPSVQKPNPVIAVAAPSQKIVLPAPIPRGQITIAPKNQPQPQTKPLQVSPIGNVQKPMESYVQPQAVAPKTPPVISSQQKTPASARLVMSGETEQSLIKDKKVEEFFGSSKPLSKQPALKKPDLDYRNLIGGGPTAINVLDDVTKITAATLRVIHPEGLLTALSQLVRAEGYFEVWFALKESPLYKIYVHTGEQMISGGHDESVLSKEEFELLTDIFKEIQIS